MPLLVDWHTKMHPTTVRKKCLSKGQEPRAANETLKERAFPQGLGSRPSSNTTIFELSAPETKQDIPVLATNEQFKRRAQFQALESKPGIGALNAGLLVPEAG
jgi:hypothetical protein